MFISTIVAYTIIHWIKLFILIYYDFRLSKWIAVNMSTLYMHILHGRVWWRFTICPDVTGMKAPRAMPLSVIPILKAKDGGSRNLRQSINMHVYVLFGGFLGVFFLFLIRLFLTSRRSTCSATGNSGWRTVAA